MLSAFRKFAGTWPARIFFLVLIASFASWGIADVVRNLGGASNAVATVHGHDITPQQFMAEFQGNMRRYAEQVPDSAQLRPIVARQTLEKLVTQAALADEVQAMGITVPDSQVAAEVFGLAQFQGPDGKFSRPMLLDALRSNNMTEAHFLQLVREDIAQNQLLQTVSAASSPSALLTQRVFQYLNEKRQADMVTLPFAGKPLPAPPADAVLKRYYDNNATRYTAPEYRHVKVAILSPDSIGRALSVADGDLRTWFEAHKADYVSPEKRSLQVITAGSASVAAKLAALWKAGANWEAMQAAAKAAGATATPLENASVQEVPSPELARAAFAAAPNTVVGPVTEPLGSYVLRVTAVTPAKNPRFDQLKDEIRKKVAAEKALDLVDARARKLQDLFAGGAKIDEVPADLGATGAEGTLDSRGNAQDGSRAPIPVPADARDKIVAAAFKANPNDAVELVEIADQHIWYAVAVDSIIKPARRPFDQVLPAVTLDWQHERVRHAQEEAAASILARVNGGKSLGDAVWGTGLQVKRTPPLSRDRPSAGVPAELAHTLFTLKLNEAAMAETNAGFVVAQLAAILPADAKTDSLAVKQAHDGLAKLLHDEYLQLYATAIRNEAKPVVRPGVVKGLITQPGE